jgi:Inhibitor of vertebrate lysozyme (Ivy)
MKLKPQKILLLVILIIITLFLIASLLVSRSRREATTGTPNIPQASNSKNAPPSGKDISSSSGQNIVNSFNITPTNELSYKFLQDNPDVVSAIRVVMPDFKITEMATSIPLSSARLSDGKEILLLSGCTEHNCGGTGIIVAYSQKENKAYVLKERLSGEQSYDILDDPPQEIRNLLACYYQNE